VTLNTAAIRYPVDRAIHTSPHNKYIHCLRRLKCTARPAVNTFWHSHTCWIFQNVRYLQE